MRLSIAMALALVVILSTGAYPDQSKIEVVAKRFSFSPDQITVNRGQPVTLSLRSQDVNHGLTIKELGIKTEIPRGRETIVNFTPEKAGTFQGKCSHFCGSGHGSMKFTVVVTE